mgnify:CR=1 FL=1
MRILFLGTRKLGYLGLKKIINAGHDVAGILTNDYDITEGYTSKNFDEIARQHNIPIFITDKINNDKFVETFKKLNFDLGVSMYWKRLVGDKVIQTAKKGFINCHAGDLPKFRGFAAINYAILMGEKEMGMCIHEMVPGEADSGDVFCRRYVPIDGDTTITELMEKFNLNFIEMTLEVLDQFDNNKLMPIKQDKTKLAYAFPRIPRDGRINWSDEAIKIDRIVKASSSPYPGAYTYYGHKKLFIWESHELNPPPQFVGSPGHVVKLNEDGSVWITTGSGILVLDKIQIDGEGEVQSPSEILKSVQIRFGMEEEEEIVMLKKRVSVLEDMIKGQGNHNE